MPAMDCYDDGAPLEQLGKADQLAVLIGHGEQRHRIAHLRGALAGTR